VNVIVNPNRVGVVFVIQGPGYGVDFKILKLRPTTMHKFRIFFALIEKFYASKNSRICNKF